MEYIIIALALLLLIAMAVASHYRQRAEAWRELAELRSDRVREDRAFPHGIYATGSGSGAGVSKIMREDGVDPARLQENYRGQG